MNHRWSSVYVLNNDSVILMPPSSASRGAGHAGKTEDFVLERMGGSTSATGQVAFSFGIEVNYGRKW